jgi:hypothetical protein
VELLRVSKDFESLVERFNIASFHEEHANRALGRVAADKVLGSDVLAKPGAGYIGGGIIRQCASLGLGIGGLFGELERGGWVKVFGNFRRWVNEGWVGREERLRTGWVS